MPVPRSNDVEAQRGERGRLRHPGRTSDLTQSSNPDVGSDAQGDGDGDGEEMVLGWKHRIRHFTWTWFTLTMATGGIANVIHASPLRFNGLYQIGVFFMICNIAFFISNTIAISLRFYYWPKTFRASLVHPTESLFVPAPLIGFAIILVNICEYGLAPGKSGAWLVTTMTVLYWVYIVLAFSASIAVYLTIKVVDTDFRPVADDSSLDFPGVPAPARRALRGESRSPPDRGRRLADHSRGCHGPGHRLHGLLHDLLRLHLPPDDAQHTLRKQPAGMFISIGPSGFTISGLIRLGAIFPEKVSPDFMGDGMIAGQITKILANWVGIWLWGLALWFLVISIGANRNVFRGKAEFGMTWFSFIFPNTALATATFAVAKALDNNLGIEIVGSIILVALIIVWLIVLGVMVRALVRKQVLWPQKQEDRDETGWRRDAHASRMSIVGRGPEGCKDATAG